MPNYVFFAVLRENYRVRHRLFFALTSGWDKNVYRDLQKHRGFVKIDIAVGGSIELVSPRRGMPTATACGWRTEISLLEEGDCRQPPSSRLFTKATEETAA